MRLSTSILTLLGSAALAGQASAGVVATLGAPTSTSNTLGDLPSWHGIGDTEDVTFTAHIDFVPNNDPNSFQTIWETGDTANGSSLIYGPDSTLYLRARDGAALTDISWQLSASQLNAGDIFVSWVVDLGNDELRLFMDGLDLENRVTNVASAAFLGNDWSGGGLASFGGGTSPVGGYSGFAASFLGDPFTSGTINTTEGLDFHRDTAFLPAPVPEPLGMMAGVAAIGFTFFRRRRATV